MKSLKLHLVKYRITRFSLFFCFLGCSTKCYSFVTGVAITEIKFLVETTLEIFQIEERDKQKVFRSLSKFSKTIEKTKIFKTLSAISRHRCIMYHVSSTLLILLLKSTPTKTHQNVLKTSTRKIIPFLSDWCKLKIDFPLKKKPKKSKKKSVFLNAMQFFAVTPYLSIKIYIKFWLFLEKFYFCHIEPIFFFCMVSISIL